MDRTKFGKKAFQLIMITWPINFVGTAALLFTLPAAASAMWSPWMYPFGSPYIVFGTIGSIFVKTLVSIFIPFIGLMLLGNYHNKAGAIVLFFCGFLTIIPIIIGDYSILFVLIEWFWIWPILPHLISGTMLIIAGVLVLLWEYDARPRANGFISTTVDSTTRYPVMRGPTCPACGHGLFGDEKYCPECGRPLQKT